MARYKVRVIIRGFTQISGIDFENIYSLTISHTALRMILLLALIHGMEIHQMDMKIAYLNGYIDRELYVE